MRMKRYLARAITAKAFACASVVLGLTLLTFQDAQAQAQADASLSLLQFSIPVGNGVSLAAGPITTLTQAEGTGVLGASNLATDLAGNPNTITLTIDLVSATAPPPVSSLYSQTVIGSFTLSNAGNTDVVVPVDWQANYLLSAFGSSSFASVDIRASLPDASGTGFADTVLVSDLQTNDGAIFGTPGGSFDISVLAGGATTFRLSGSVTAGAAVIPEPGTLALAATGLLPLAGAVVRKRRCKA
jgi:hypothetical protein